MVGILAALTIGFGGSVLGSSTSYALSAGQRVSSSEATRAVTSEDSGSVADDGHVVLNTKIMSGTLNLNLNCNIPLKLAGR